MKKLIKYILIVLIVIIALPSKESSLSDLIKEFNYSNALYSFYSSSEVKELSATIIKNGNSFIVNTNVSNADSVRNNINNIQGESVTFNGTYNDYVTLKTKLFNKFCFDEELLSIKTCYGYNNNLNNSISIDGNVVNIQLAYNNGNITIGTPVILGSY